MQEPTRIAASPSSLTLHALTGIPIAQPGDDPAALVLAALARHDLELADGDVVVIASKLVARAEGRFVDLSTLAISDEAAALAAEIDQDPALVALILDHSASISRKAPGALIVRHRLGFIAANAGIDLSNSQPLDAPPGSGPWALTLPADPDRSAADIRAALEAASGAAIGLIVSDSFGRPFREGTVGVAVGLSGLPALWDQRGGADLFGRTLEHTITALADQVAAAADLLAGQAAEATPAVLVRGLTFTPAPSSARDLDRPPHKDLYA